MKKSEIFTIDFMKDLRDTLQQNLCQINEVNLGDNEYAALNKIHKALGKIKGAIYLFENTEEGK